MDGNDKRMEAIRAYAAACRYEQGHSEQVARLALMLFDGLGPLHKLDAGKRFCLEAAAVLHDIGWAYGQQKHHKQSMQMILDQAALPLSPPERVLVALTARYHRKALPRPDHPVYGELDADQRDTVDRLAAILRLADGLDRSHTDAVTSLRPAMCAGRVELCCLTRGPADDELKYGKEKADLFEKVFACTVLVTRQCPDK